MAANVASGSNRGSTTMWFPWMSPVIDAENGALWYSGPGTTWQPSLWTMRNMGWSGSNTPGSPARMSLGRPVDPPDVGAFQDGATRSGSSPSSSAGSGSNPAGITVRPGWAPGSAPTTRAESASSTMAWRSG